jgi:hypothetical protein
MDDRPIHMENGRICVGARSSRADMPYLLWCRANLPVAVDDRAYAGAVLECHALVQRNSGFSSSYLLAGISVVIEQTSANATEKDRKPA